MAPSVVRFDLLALLARFVQANTVLIIHARGVRESAVEQEVCCLLGPGYVLLHDTCCWRNVGFTGQKMEIGKGGYERTTRSGIIFYVCTKTFVSCTWVYV